MIKAAQQWTFDALIPVLDSIRKPKVFVPCGFSGLLESEYANYFQDMPQWLGKFDRLIFYATDYRDINMARRHGLERLAVIPNGADEREFAASPDRSFRDRHGVKQDAFLVLTVGSMTGLKGHVEVAQAFEKCDFGDRHACLILNGNTPPRKSASGVVGLRSRIRGMLEGLGLGSCLERLGYARRAVPFPDQVARIVARINSMPGRQALVCDLPRQELVQAYLNSDLFVFASKIEYSPLVLFESAAAGLPFLSVPVGNAAEIAQWTAAGVICPAEVDSSGYTNVDIEVLAAEISRLARETGRLADLGKNGRCNWEQRFTWGKISRLYERLFEECLQKAQA
jgi:glycosyltransferase involved in cell wall biosynthesis